VKRFNLAFLLALASLLVGVSRPASAQNITAVDIQRLQDSIDDVSRDVTELRARDGALAAQLQAQLDDLRDETIYLKVKIRKNESVPRSDYFDMRDRIDNVRTQARATTRAALPAPPSSTRSTDGSSTSSRMDVPVGTELDVRIQQSLSSATAVVEDRFEATTLVDLKQGDRVMIPAGSVMRGVVSSVTKTTRVERKGA
jgi:TolA-binding protein